MPDDSTARVPLEISQLLDKRDVQDLNLCRFLNTSIFIKQKNYELMDILSGIKNPRIGPLKIAGNILNQRVGFRRLS